MKKVKTSELIGPALDWAVAKCEGKNGVLHDDGITRCIVIAASSGVYKGIWRPSLNWMQSGPIVEREIGNLWKHNKLDPNEPDVWTAAAYHKAPDGTMLYYEDGHTPLIAAMRCFVSSKLGDEVEIPEELL